MARLGRTVEIRAVDVFARRGNQIFREQDPLGLIAEGAPDDEYDCVITGVMIELMSERVSTLETWLTAHFEEHYGATPDRQRVSEAARELVALWRSEDLAALRP